MGTSVNETGQDHNINIPAVHGDVNFNCAQCALTNAPLPSTSRSRHHGADKTNARQPYGIDRNAGRQFGAPQKSVLTVDRVKASL
jgi:hypothetical protein